ncbi:MAG: translation initiation factor IF-2 [Gammaproteobacteria bacterium]|nr:translation initiation factor IF-2 [Gammaproteobacteria bacterium]
MMQVTVRQLANSVGTPVERLLDQLSEAGLPHREADEHINDEDKAQLLEHLRTRRGTSAKPKVEKRLSVKRKQVSEIKVSSTAGRRKTVTVEVRKRRTLPRKPQEAGANAARGSEPAAAESYQRERMEAAKRDLAEQAKRRQLELGAQLRAEAEAKELEETRRKAEEPARRKAEAKARAKAEEEARVQAEQEREEEEVRAAELAKKEAARVAAQEERRQREEEEAQRSAEAERAAREAEEVRRSQKQEEEREARFGRKELHVAADKSGRRRKKAQSKTSTGRRVPPPSTGRQAFERPTAPIVREVSLPETISVADLAQRMSVKASAVIKVMMSLGSMVTINQVVDQETAAVVVEEMGHKPKLLNENTIEDEVLSATGENDYQAVPRSPIVTIMGHVDHGKTSLLDCIRKAKVTASEAGGITQHIGAYHVEIEQGGITFLDTPGHAAFTAMRARGAKSTDIVVLVVAADDGVMPQTEEAIQHAKAAGVPLIVAVNKIDREEAAPDRVKQELSNREVIPEDWGGDTQFVHISAITGQGVDGLLEAILLQAEVLELTAPTQGAATGVVIESRLDRGRGPVATVLVQGGTLRRGDMLLAGQEYGRIRGMFDERGAAVETAGPAMPVEVLGLSAPPNAGDEALVVADERKAREVAQLRQSRSREVKLARQQATSLDAVFSQLKEDDALTLNVVLKADVHGSTEALRDALERVSTDEAKVKVVASSTGGINETDVNLAIAANAIMIGFNVRAESSARRVIEAEKIDLHYFSVIYDVIDTVKSALQGLLKPEMREQIVGIAQVRDVFRARRYGAIAGCMVMEGAVKRSNPIRVLRDNVVIFEGELESLRRFQDDVQEVKSGMECGIGVRSYNDVKPGDQIEVFERVQIERRL